MVGVVADLHQRRVGEASQHPFAFSSWYELVTPSGEIRDLPTTTLTRDAAQEALVSPNGELFVTWLDLRSGMLTTNFGEAGGFIKSRPVEPTPDLQLHFVIGKLVDHGRKTVFGHGYSCHVCLLRPKMAS